MAKESRRNEIELLSEAFQAFNIATEKLQNSYAALKEETEKLRKEIEEKNKQLEEMSSLLSSVLMSANSAIVALDDNGKIIISNRKFDELYNFYGDKFLDFLMKNMSKGIYEKDFEKSVFRISVGKFNHNGLDGWTFSIDDITEFKEMEKEHRRDEHLKAMGVMAANIAHEIRNPLGSIELFASLLSRDLKNNLEKRSLADSILKGVKSINSTISNILLFSKDVVVKIEKHYLADIIDDVVLYLRHLMIDKNINFINRIDEDSMIYCDKELMKQVFMNLIHNAIDAVDENGKIELYNFCDKEFDVIVVEDNGCGIEKEFLDKIFIPFHTTKTKGTGLGLSIVYKIIKAHKGNIFVESDGKSYTKILIKLKRGENVW
ncbi:GHKL domain-containing protein [Deferribacter autotrophicus]|uniref:histidine kinase n=1 Tax=Deferribacter autotrophicus TaxID=500465 RepID=A0A5A8F727_9BACT|nr:ATP-binding protein [Deferribacter autotrophicus]KAA0259505.1 GHKL domain-containing protein [Deferribacter autotrophicus]